MDDSVGKYIVFKFKPTKPDRPSPTKYQGLSGPVKKFADRLEQNRAKEFKNSITSSGPINVTATENLRFKETGTFAQDHRGEQLSASLSLYAQGADPYLVLGEVEKFKSKVPPEARKGVMDSMYNTVDGLENLTAGDESLSFSLRDINQEPNITLSYIEIKEYTPRSNEIAFSYTPDAGFRQVYDMARPLADKPIAKLKGKAKKKALKLLNKGAKKIGKKAGAKAVQRLAGKGVGKAVGTAVTGIVASTPLAPIAPIVGKIADFLTKVIIDKILIPLAKKLKKAAKYIAALGMAVLGAGVLMASPFLIIGGGMMIAGSVMAGGVVAITAGIIAIRAVVPFLFMSFLAGILPALLIALVVTPLIIAFTIFVITTGAYVVPGPAGIIGGVDDTPVIKLPFPGGGGIPGSAFYCGDDPNTIAAPGAEVRLLPDNNPTRATGLCVTPTIIVIHWSAAWTSVTGTYWSLVSSGLACQFATDNDTSLQMQRLWPDKVEYSRCAGGDYNNYALNVEMTGKCFTYMPISACTPGLDEFTFPQYEPEFQKTVDLTCWMMQQYNIGIDQIVGHYEISPGKSDPGDRFLNEIFIPGVRAQCGDGTEITPDIACNSSVLEIDDATRSQMINNSWKTGCPVPISDLKKVQTDYWDFSNNKQTGEIIVHKDFASEVAQTFKTMCENKFPIDKMEPIYNYGGDDNLSMQANNTSGFNCRTKTASSDWSEHAYGRAIDINPVQNPYVSGSTVLPPSGGVYTDRSKTDPGMIRSGDPAYNAFRSIGWPWGGNWSSVKDYMHFSSTGN